jgi:hypothetical protein
MTRLAPWLASVAVVGLGLSPSGAQAPAPSTPEGAPWVMVIRKGSRPETWWQKDDVLLKLIVGQDLEIRTDQAPAGGEGPVPPPLPEGATWMLYEPETRRTLPGDGSGTGEDILAPLHASGFLTRWEVLENFLKEHPDHGEALEARLELAIRLARQRYHGLVDQRIARKGKLALPPDQQGEAWDAIFQETADTLGRLALLPDGWRFSQVDLFGFLMATMDAGASPRMRDALERLEPTVLAAWAVNPRTGTNLTGLDGVVFGDESNLGRLWLTVETALRRDRIPACPDFLASPEGIWPGSDLMRLIFFRAVITQDWEGWLSRADAAPREPACPVPAAQWEEHCLAQANYWTYTTVAQAKRGTWTEARTSQALARQWGGKAVDATWWQTYSLDPATPETGEPTFECRPPADFFASLAQPGDPAPANPCPVAPIRLVHFGSPGPWWSELSKAPALALWGPDELILVPASALDQEFAARKGIHPAWMARKGEALLAMGNGQPEPRLLEAQLRAAGSTRLQRLETFIRQHPDHLDARRDRFNLVRPRLPNPLLEPFALADAAKAWISVAWDPEGAWKPNPALWQPVAERILPDLEASLGRWPTNPRLWRAWIAWNALRAKPRSPKTFAESLTPFGPRAVWMARLPMELHAAVAEDLMRTKHFAAMRDWFQEVWDARRACSPEGVERIYRYLQQAHSALGLRPLDRPRDRQE